MHNINLILRKLLLHGKNQMKKQWKKNSAYAAAGVLFAVIIADAAYFNIAGNAVADQSKIAMIQDDAVPEMEIAELESDEILRVMETMSVEQETDTEETQSKPVSKVSGAEPVKRTVISYSEEDYNNFLRMVEAEATGGDIKAKILVANVIINRVKSPNFPNTVTEVIFQGNGEQFQPIMDGRFYSVSVKSSTVEAVDRALLGEDYSQGALFFAAKASVTPYSWHATRLTRLFEYGGHVYFTY